MDALGAAVAFVRLVLTAVGVWLTVFYGQRTCALLKGLMRRDSQ
jgi:hypothetical protein